MVRSAQIFPNLWWKASSVITSWHHAAQQRVVGAACGAWRRRPSRGPRPASACRRASCRPRARARSRSAGSRASAPHATGRPQRALMYFAKPVTWRASSRVWLAAYSCAPGSRSMWQRLAERESAPCSPCRIDDIVKRVLSLASWIFWPSSSLSATAHCSSMVKSRGMMVSWSTSNGSRRSRRRPGRSGPSGGRASSR